MNLYEFGLTPTTPPVITPTDPVGYTDQGCYTDSTSQRALTGKVYYDDLMTVAKCADACSAFTWFGVEYGREVCQLGALFWV